MPIENTMPRFMNAWITVCLDNIRVHWMPRQCISKRNKNIKERKNIQSETEFKEFERQFKFKPPLKYAWFHLK